MYIVSIKGRRNCNLAGLILIPTLLKQNMIWYYVVYTLVKQVSAVRRDFIGLEKRLMCSKTCPFFWSEGKKMVLLTYCAWLTCICTAIFSHAITTFNLWMATEGWEWSFHHLFTYFTSRKREGNKNWYIQDQFLTTSQFNYFFFSSSVLYISMYLKIAFFIANFFQSQTRLLWGKYQNNVQ